MAYPELIRKALTPKREWFEKGFAGYPHFIIGICEGIVQIMHRRFGDGFHWAVGFCQNQQFNWFWQVKDMVRLREKIVARTIRDPHYPDKLIKTWKKDWTKFLATVDEVRSAELSGLSDPALVRLYQKLYRVYNWEISLAQLTDSFLTTGSEDWLDIFLRQRQPNLTEPEYHQLFTKLSAPIYNSFSNTEHINLLRIAVTIKRRPELQRRILGMKSQDIPKVLAANPVLEKNVRGHLGKFYWTENNYFHVHYFTVEHYLRKIQKLLRDHPLIEKQYRIERDQIVKNKRIKQILIKKYRLPSDVKAVVHLIEEFMIWHDTRKSGVLRNNDCLERFLKEIGRRKKIPLKELYYSTSFEIGSVLLGGKDLRHVWRERQKRCVFIFTRTEHAVLAGAAIKGFTIRDLTGAQIDANELHGVPASNGRVIGKVRLIIRQQDFKKMKNGEILVTNNTTPEFVPLMKKAIAIVAEQGGMTTHAAIVSRELGIPCVIGTKVATKVLKDGDKVEVDATKGVVRKL